MVGRWPKRHGEDTHDLFTDPDPTDHDDGEAPASR
jgi:hypothetical protein